MSTLTPRERVLTVLNHEEPDRIPFIIGVGHTTGFSMQAYRRLKAQMGFDFQERFLYDWPELGAAWPDEAVLGKLGSDARSVLDRFPERVARLNRNRKPGKPYVDDWGVGQVETAPGSYYPGIHPLEAARSRLELDAYPHWPDMEDPTRYAHVRARAQALAEENRYAIFAAPWLLFPFERACQLQGMQTFLGNLALRRDFAQALLVRITERCKAHMDNFLKALAGNVDVVMIGDDLGTQESLLISPQMYRGVLKPIHADWIAFIKARTTAKIFFHSDGDISPLIEDLIEIGVDILNPIQTSAGQMADLAMLKRRFGKRLCFCGALDTQHILPHGSPSEVLDEVQRVVGMLGTGGGYLLAAVHTIMPDVPPENILAMAAAVELHGRYPLSG